MVFRVSLLKLVSIVAVGGRRGWFACLLFFGFLGWVSHVAARRASGRASGKVLLRLEMFLRG